MRNWFITKAAILNHPFLKICQKTPAAESFRQSHSTEQQTDSPEQTCCTKVAPQRMFS